jgi:mRNA interferase HigB
MIAICYHSGVRIVGRDQAASFAAEHPDAASSLRAWIAIVEAASFRHFVELKAAFGSADFVPPHTVFDIAGNKYRLAALVNYAMGIVSIVKVMTHAEYDRGRWRKRR